MSLAELPQLGKAFGAPEHFQARAGTTYSLLPLRFLWLDGERYIVTNLVGEYIVLQREDPQSES